MVAEHGCIFDQSLLKFCFNSKIHTSVGHRQSLEVASQGFSCFLITRCGHENNDFICCKKFFQSVHGCQLFANIWHYIVKVTVIKLLTNNIESTLEFALHVYLGKSGPLRVEFQPLAYALIA